MPIIPWPEDAGLRIPEPYRPAPEQASPTLGQVAGAAFRADNDVVNAADWLTRPTFEPREGYDVFQDPAFKGSIYQQHFDRNFWNSRSEAETQSIIARIDREQEDRRTLDASGVGGVIMGLAAGIASPTTLLPGGALVRGARGLSALRSALSVGTAAAGAVAAQEAVLQGTQETRTLTESAINVASGAILGGLLGAGGAALVGRAERRMLERGLDEARLPFGERDAPVPNPAANLVRDDVLTKLGAAGVPEEEAAANAVLWQARYDARARRLGLDPAQAFDLYQKEGVDIRAAEAPDLLGEDALAQAARWKEIPVGDDLVARGSVRRGAGGSDVVAFDLFRQPKDGATLPEGGQGALGQVELVRRGDGRWEVDWSRVPESERGKGYASRLYDVVEKELGADMVPSGTLLPDGHAFWTARNPDLVQWHRKVGKAWYSPRRMEEELAGLRAQEAADPGSTGTRIQAFEQALGSVPAEGRAPEAMARMFQDENAPRGAIDLADNKALIYLFQGRDASTFMHESGHLWLTEMVRDAEVSPAVKADLDATLHWLGVDDASKIGVEHQEKWAQGFERYLRDGKAPTTALARVFEQFRDWLTSIYRAVSDLGDDLPEEIRGVMDRLLTAPEGHGPFGPMFRGFTDNPEGAIAKLMAEKGGEVPDAFMHPQLGNIALVYGDEKMGLRHIEAKRGASFVERIPDVLKTGQVVSDASSLPRAFVVTDHDPAHVVVVRLDWDGMEKTWVVTSFDDEWGKFRGAGESARNQREAYRTGSSDPRVPGSTEPMKATLVTGEAQPLPIGERPAGGWDGSIGAASSDTRALTLERFGLDRVPGIMKLSPTLRAFSSPFASVRRAAADLSESALQFVENRAGVATTQGPALDRLARMQVAQARVAVADEMDRLFSQMRFNRPVAAPNLRAFAEDVTGRGTPGAMSREVFNMEVGRAMRRGDQHEVPEVAQAAQFIRAKVFTPWKDRAIKAGLLPEDVGVDTAESYFQRVYDKGQIAARRDEFVRTVSGWLGADQAQKASAQQRLAGMWEDKQAAEKAMRRMEAQGRRLDARMQKLDAALAERAMEVGRTERRAGTLEDRQTLLAQEISDLEEFVGAMKGEIADPVLRDRILNLEGELKDLRRADRPVTEAQVRAAEQQELRSILTGETRVAAQMLVGQRKPYKAPAFLDWIVRGGGIDDAGGEVMGSLGGARSTKPGLVSAAGRSADEWGERMVEASGGMLTERPTPNDVLDWINAATRGEDPWWWRETRVDEAKARASQMAAAWEEALARAGAPMPENITDVAKMLRGEMQAAGGRGISLEDLDRILADMEEAGASVSPSVQRQQVEGMLAAEKDGVRALRDLIGRARADAGRLEARAGRDAIRQGEADLAVGANRGRLGILNDRMDRIDRLQGLVETFQRDAQARVEMARQRIEDELGAWEGKSTAEAMAALRQRAKAEEGRAAGSPRLGGADRAVDAAVRKILASDRGLSEQELAAKASEITNRILGSPDGRLPYDAPSGGPRIGIPSDGPAPRGPLAAREFMIPDQLIEDFLVSDAEEVAGTHLRTIVPDVLLTERFGDVDMTYVFKAIDEDANAAAQAAPDNAARRQVEADRKAAIRDVAAMRDRVRGTYGFSSDAVMQAAGRVGNAVKSFNVLTSMGGTILSSVSDMAGPVFRNGFTNVLRDGWVPWFQSLADRSEASPWRQAAGQYRAMGIATEMVLAGRFHGVAEITDLYRPHTRLERGLRWGADKLQVVNLQAPWTDWGKTTAAIVSGNEVLRAAKAVSEGRVNSRQVANLAAAGIDGNMATKIWSEFQAGGNVVDGVHLPNTAQWRDGAARAAFEGAVAREVDIAIVTPGQEKPLWLSNPLLSVVGQFKTFVASSTERTLIANLQRRDAEALQGAITAVALGMVGYKLYSLFSGQKTSDRPQDWVKEGISRSGILGWLEDGNALAAKTTRGSVDLYRAIGADKPLSRFASRSVLDQLLGPTAGKIDALARATGSAATGEWTASDTHKVRTLIATQNLFYLRGLFDAAEAGVNGMFGVPEQKARR